MVEQPNQTEAIRYTLVTLDTKELEQRVSLDKIEPKSLNVRTYGLSAEAKHQIEAHELERMNQILLSNPKAIPREISTVGYGPEFHVAPYWCGAEKDVVQEICKRIKEHGFKNLIVMERAITQDGIKEKIDALREKYVDNYKNNPAANKVR